VVVAVVVVVAEKAVVVVVPDNLLQMLKLYQFHLKFANNLLHLNNNHLVREYHHFHIDMQLYQDQIQDRY
jgi:hypothetical protein